MIAAPLSHTTLPHGAILSRKEVAALLEEATRELWLAVTDLQSAAHLHLGTREPKRRADEAHAKVQRLKRQLATLS